MYADGPEVKFGPWGAGCGNPGCLKAALLVAMQVSALAHGRARVPAHTYMLCSESRARFRPVTDSRIPLNTGRTDPAHRGLTVQVNTHFAWPLLVALSRPRTT